jgi:hypothetical protein
MVKKQIENIDNDDLDIRTINVNRNFVSVTYESKLDNDEVKELFVNKLSSKELFGIKFETDSLPDSTDTVKIIKFRIK